MEEMELTELMNTQKGYLMRWNIIDFSEKVTIPPDMYFRNGKQLIAALGDKKKGYTPSNKYSYLQIKD